MFYRNPQCTQNHHTWLRLDHKYERARLDLGVRDVLSVLPYEASATQALASCIKMVVPGFRFPELKTHHSSVALRGFQFLAFGGSWCFEQGRSGSGAKISWSGGGGEAYAAGHAVDGRWLVDSFLDDQIRLSKPEVLFRGSPCCSQAAPIPYF